MDAKLRRLAVLREKITANQRKIEVLKRAMATYPARMIRTTINMLQNCSPETLNACNSLRSESARLLVKMKQLENDIRSLEIQRDFVEQGRHFKK